MHTKFFCKFDVLKREKRNSWYLGAMLNSLPRKAQAKQRTVNIRFEILYMAYTIVHYWQPSRNPYFSKPMHGGILVHRTRNRFVWFRSIKFGQTTMLKTFIDGSTNRHGSGQQRFLSLISKLSLSNI